MTAPINPHQRVSSADSHPISVSHASRIQGLDTLRFLAALWVAAGHGATFPFNYLVAIFAPQVSLSNSVNGIFFNGVAAVMFFFLISGFCIHLPNITTRRFDPVSFLVRRYLRIGIPLLTMIAIINIAGGKIGDAGNNVLWTIYCELIYYVLYPVLRIAMKKVGTLRLTIAAFGIALALALLNLDYMNFWDFGFGTWIIGLPAWLLGCLLAESFAQAQHSLSPPKVLRWRIGGIALSTAALLLVFHGPVRIGFPITLNLFAIYSFFWIRVELVRYRSKLPLRILEWAGLWSYSLYLIHNMVIAALATHRLTINPILFWVCQVATIAVCSYAFYLLVEKPSHALARHWSHRLRSRRAIATS